MAAASGSARWHGKASWLLAGASWILAGVASLSPTACGPPQGVLFFFIADDGVHGSELWKSDGTPQGTVRVKAGFARPSPSQAVGETLFLSADDARSGQELWRSDGTEGGTLRVKDIRPGPESSNPRSLTVMTRPL